MDPKDIKDKGSSSVLNENELKSPSPDGVVYSKEQKQGVPSQHTSDEIKKEHPKEIIPPLKKKLPKNLIVAVSGLVFVGIMFFVIRAIALKIQGEKGQEVVWWGINFNEQAVSGLISEYEKNNPLIKVKYTKQSSKDYRERLTNALLKGEGPDIFEFHNTWVPMFSQDLETIPSNVMSAADYTKTFYPVVSTDMSLGKGFVGIPLAYDSLTLYINEELFEKQGTTPPATWDDLKKKAEEFTIRDDNGVIKQAGIPIGRTENVDYWQEILGLMLVQNGADLTNPSDSKTQEALNYFISFSKDEEGVWDTTMPLSTKAFAAGKVAMYLGTGKEIENIKSINPELRFKTVPAPQVAKATPDQPDISYATYWVQGINSKSKKIETSWNFLKYLSEKDNLIKLHEAQGAFIGIYPRVDMLDQLEDPLYGSIVSMAQSGKTWYLQSNTNDGENGINTLVNNAYKEAIDNLNSRVTMKKVIEKLVTDMNQILNTFFVLE